MKCINCANFRFKNSELEKNDMPLLGYGRCGFNKQNYYYVSYKYERNCDKFIEVSELEIEARREEFKEIRNPKLKESE